MVSMSATRLWVLLALLLTLPVYGLAGVAQRSCQEQMSASSHLAQVGDCCPGKTDQGTPCKKTGEGPLGKGSCTACKAGYSCKSPQSYEPALGLVLYIVPRGFLPLAEPRSISVSHSPDGLWRPPIIS